MPDVQRPVFEGVDFTRGRLFDTADVDEAREVSGRVFNPHQLQLVGRGQRLRAVMDHLPLGAMSLNRLTWGACVRVDPQRLGCYYLLSLPVAGQARFHLGSQAFEVSPRCAGLVNAAQRFHFEASAQFEQIVVRFEREAVDEAWRALSGEWPAAPIDFEPRLPLDGDGWRALQPALGLLAGCARGEFAQRGLPHVHARIEELLLTTLLLRQRAASPPVRGAPLRAGAAHVRRIQALLRERLDEPWTLADMGRASGLATRTLQSAFQAHCGMGPMQWLREQRLHAVHAALADAADPRVRVTDTALRLGFTHLGEFARAYRQRFGESPRETLARRG